MKTLFLILTLGILNQALANGASCDAPLVGNTFCDLRDNSTQYLFNKDCTFSIVKVENSQVKGLETGIWVLVGEDKFFSSIEGRASLNKFSINEEKGTVLLDGKEEFGICK